MRGEERGMEGREEWRGEEREERRGGREELVTFSVSSVALRACSLAVCSSSWPPGVTVDTGQLLS